MENLSQVSAADVLSAVANNGTKTTETTIQDQTVTTTEDQASDQTTQSTDQTAQDDKKAPASAQFSALAKKQKWILREQERIKAEKADVEAKLAEYNKWKEDQSKPKQKLSPLEALQAAGYTYEDATNYLMNDSKPTPDLEIKSLRDELEAIRNEQKELESKRAEEIKKTQEEQERRAVESFKSEIKSFVSNNKDTYELINLHDVNHLIYDTIDEYFNKTHKVMEIKEAADLVESYLEDQVLKSTQTKKLSSKLAKVEQEENENRTAQPQKTLSNSMSGASSVKTNQYISDEDAMQRALLAMKKAAS